MLTRVEVFSELPNPRTMPLVDDATVADDPIQIRRIDGLGPVKANITTSPFANYNGEFYIGSAVRKRNIVITVGLNPNWQDQTMASLRMALYSYFMPQLSVRLRFHGTHIPTVDIRGFVESVEPNIFTQDPEFQVSILCPDPDFVSADMRIVTGEVTRADDTTVTEVNYMGNSSAGFVLRIRRLGSRIPASSFRIDPSFFTINTNGLGTQDYIELSSIPGDKYIRHGDSTSILWTADLDYEWPRMVPGVNRFAVRANPIFTDSQWELRYYDRLGGI